MVKLTIFNIQNLAAQNPWWADKQGLAQDFQYRRYIASDIRWIPELINDFNLDKDCLYTLRGPRQVGKSTTLKIIINKLLSSLDNRRRVFFYACDLIQNENELADLIRSYIELVSLQTAERKYIFLDEVSQIRNWQKALKHLWDTGMFDGCSVIVTGSHSLDIKAGGELMPGRRGAVNDPDKVLLPLCFREYIGLLRPEESEDIPRVKLSRDPLQIRQLVSELSAFAGRITRYNHQFDDYLMTGGFLTSINSFLNRRIEPYVYDTYLQWIKGDFLKAGKSEAYLCQITANILSTMGTPVSWNALLKNSNIGSHHTVHDYVDTLEDTFVARSYHKYDPGRKQPFYGKNKKIYVRDPFLYHALHGWAGRVQDICTLSVQTLAHSPTTGVLVESVVAEHLERYNPKGIYYWKNHREIDFVTADASGLLPIEVKYQRSIGQEDLRELDKFGYGILLSMDTLALKGDIAIIPVSLFLAML